MRRLSMMTAVAAMFLTSGLLTAGEKKMMHCFAFTPIETATEAEWKAFYEATDKWPKQFNQIHHVWYGKLRGPLTQFSVDADTNKKLREGAKDVAATKTNRVVRSYGVCMEMDGPDTLKAYTQQPFHKEWTAAYEKVRVAGTTTYDILGQ
jgi:hypothetical protein